MKKTKATPMKKDTTKGAVLYMALELSQKQWKLGFSDGKKMRFRDIGARVLEQLQEEIELAKLKFDLQTDGRIKCCYEAGRDGFWLHRYLLSCGINNVVVDSSSIEVNRWKRRLKTDRVDSRKLLQMLMRYHGGERKLWSVVNVPSAECEDVRHLNRELETLTRERTMHLSRIRGLLIQQGLEVKNPSGEEFLRELDSLRIWNGNALPEGLKERLVREYERLKRAPGMTQPPFFWHQLPEVKLPAVTGRKGYANKARAVPEMGCLKEA